MHIGTWIEWDFNNDIFLLTNFIYVYIGRIYVSAVKPVCKIILLFSKIYYSSQFVAALKKLRHTSGERDGLNRLKHTLYNSKL